MNFLIADRYEYKRHLGQGGMGHVFLAYDNKLNKYWAVKKCTELNDSEINALKTIDTFYFPRIVDVVRENEQTYIVMDYIEGQTLTDYVQSRALPEAEILRISMQIAKALEYLHKQLPTMLYMDCKPDNIMITASNEVRLVDLGSVYVCGSTSPQRISSTMTFASPEIVSHTAEYSPEPSADIYSLGMTMYYMATGRSIEYRDRMGRLNIRWRNKHISAKLEYIIRKCTSIQAKRYKSANELYEDLHSVKTDKVFSISRRIAPGNYSWSEAIDIICKLSLTIAILLWANCMSLIAFPLWSSVMFFMTGAFLIICRNTRLNTVETKKNIFRGVGGRFLITLFLCLIGIGTYANAANSSSEPLNVVLYDDCGRTLLLQTGLPLPIDENINFSIPCSEINPGISTLTIRCESGETVKEYSVRINNPY